MAIDVQQTIQLPMWRGSERVTVTRTINLPVVPRVTDEVYLSATDYAQVSLVRFRSDNHVELIFDYQWNMLNTSSPEDLVTALVADGWTSNPPEPEPDPEPDPEPEPEPEPQP